MPCSISTTRWCSALELPPTVNAAINRKIEQYYLVQEYAFRVEREKKESERKQIEAEGIRDFQQTVTQGISDSYVRWRGIEATLQLAQSPNTKIVIIGSGKDGLPVILGNVDTPTCRRPAARSRTTARPRRNGPCGAPAAAGKSPGKQLANPPEQPPPTAVPRAPAGPPSPLQPASPPPNSTDAMPGNSPPGRLSNNLRHGLHRFRISKALLRV